MIQSMKRLMDFLKQLGMLTNLFITALYFTLYKKETVEIIIDLHRFADML